MSNKRILSSAFNMSLGFIPVIISIILCEFIAQDMSIYIGTGIGIIYSYLIMRRENTCVPNFILYISTAVLSLVSLATFIPGDCIPPKTLPITLEVSILTPMLILYLHKKRFINYYLKQKEVCNRRLFVQGAESAIVAARIILILGCLHFIAASLSALFLYPMEETTYRVLFSILPLVIFIFCIVFNQIGLNYFNKLMSHTEYVPIVNTQGSVIGKCPAIEAINYKNDYINPVIRIAVISHGLLFLCSHLQRSAVSSNKTDIPFECYLRYGETLAQGCRRILQNSFPETTGLKPAFSIMYHFENETTNRLVYLFILDVKDDSILCKKRFKNGKLWQLQQIASNLNQHFFSECFEEEYEHLKEVIGIREKYMEF